MDYSLPRGHGGFEALHMAIVQVVYLVPSSVGLVVVLWDGPTGCYGS